MAEAVGEIRVDMALNSGQFATGIKQAQQSMSGFQAAVVGMAAGIGLAVGQALGNVARSVTSAFDQADNMSKNAQKIGISTEELSKLGYAAKLADVDTEKLNSSMARLARNMSDAIRNPTSDAAQAFNALGISLKNADGSTKSVSQATSEIAGKMSGFADGTNKTALAMAFFGKTGADLIPLLNGGAEGLASAGAEAEKFGLVISSSTGVAAEAFNDNMTRLGAILNGAVLTVMGKIAPEFERLSSGMVDAAGGASTFEGAAEGVAIVIRGLVNIAVHATRTIRELNAAFRAIGEAGASVMKLDMQGVKDAGNGFLKEYDRINAAHKETLKTMNTPASPFGTLASAKNTIKPTKPEAPSIEKAEKAGKAAKQAADETEGAYDRIERAGRRVWEETRTPMEKLANELGKLQDMLSVGAINWETYERAVKMANDKYNKAALTFSDIGKSLDNSLGDMWGDFIDGTLNASEAIKDLGKNMLKMIGNKLIGSFIDSLFGGKGGAGAGGGFLGGIMKAIGLPGFAAGGDFTGGKAIVVGERGPEIITPRVSGTVVPNHELGGPSGGAPVVNVINSSGARAETRQREGAGGTPIVDVLIGELARDVAQNGRLAQTLQGMYGVSRSAGRR